MQQVCFFGRVLLDIVFELFPIFFNDIPVHINLLLQKHDWRDCQSGETTRYLAKLTNNDNRVADSDRVQDASVQRLALCDSEHRKAVGLCALQNRTKTSFGASCMLVRSVCGVFGQD